MLTLFEEILWHSPRPLKYASFALFFFSMGLVVGCQDWMTTSMPEGYDACAVGELRFRRDAAESIAAHFAARENAGTAQILYGNARSANNALIARMIVALGEPESTEREQMLSASREHADSEYFAFAEWSQRTLFPEQDQNGEQMAVESATGSSSDLIMHAIEMQENAAREQRNVVRRQLENCMWPSWTDCL